jgi:hypothetical protein
MGQIACRDELPQEPQPYFIAIEVPIEMWHTADGYVMKALNGSLVAEGRGFSATAEILSKALLKRIHTPR